MAAHQNYILNYILIYDTAGTWREFCACCTLLGNAVSAKVKITKDDTGWRFHATKPVGLGADLLEQGNDGSSKGRALDEQLPEKASKDREADEFGKELSPARPPQRHQTERPDHADYDQKPE